MTAPAVTEEKTLLRIGAMAAISLGIGYLLIVALYVPMGGPPRGLEARLAYFGAHIGEWWAVIWLSIITDLLFVPVGFSLYRTLKELSRNSMVFAAAFIALFVVLDLAVTWPNYAALMAASMEYANAAAPSQKAVALAAAAVPAAVLDSNVLFVYNSLTLAVGILIAGIVMLRGVFSRLAAYLGVVTGAMGIFSVITSFVVHDVGIAIFFTSVLTTAWLFAVGFRLNRLAH